MVQYVLSLILKFSWIDFFLYFLFLFSILKDFFKFGMNVIYLWGFPCGSAGKESTCNAGNLGSIPGLGRSLGEGKGYPLQYSGLENSIDCTVHGSQRVRHDSTTFTCLFIFKIEALETHWKSHIPGWIMSMGVPHWVVIGVSLSFL